jgi:hypothetical protein
MGRQLGKSQAKRYSLPPLIELHCRGLNHAYNLVRNFVRPRPPLERHLRPC